MNRAGYRSARRVRLAAIVSVALMLALGSFWVLEVMRRSLDETPAGPPTQDPDYYVEKFQFVRMSQTGQPRYHLAGDKLTHFPHNDSYLIEKPVLQNHSTEALPMTMRAERGVVDHGNTQIHMYDDVQVERPASPTAEYFHLNTEYLQILPDDDVMQTDKAAILTFGTSTLAGAGMYANNATREFRLAQRVRGTYRSPPPQQAESPAKNN